jgi:hypothetical protein
MHMTEIPRSGRPDVTRVPLAEGWRQVDQQTFEFDGHSFGSHELVGIEHGGHAADARCLTGPVSSVLAVESVPRRGAGAVPSDTLPPPAWP